MSRSARREQVPGRSDEGVAELIDARGLGRPSGTHFALNLPATTLQFRLKNRPVPPLTHPYCFSYDAGNALAGYLERG